MSCGGKQDHQEIDSGVNPGTSVSADLHPEETFGQGASSASVAPSESVRPFRELSENVYTFKNGRSKNDEMVLDSRPSLPGSAGHPVVFKVGGESEGGRTTVPLQEQQSGESEVLKNIRLAKEAYINEMKYKDGQISNLEMQLDEANEKEIQLTEELTQMREQKNDAEHQLRQTQAEYSRVVKEKDEEISGLKEQIKEKEQTIDVCRTEISVKELENQQMREEHECEIKSLKEQLKTKQKKYNEEVRELLDKKHSLELTVKDLQINEEKLKTELELSRRQAADLRATLAEERLAKKDAECSEKDQVINRLRSESDANLIELEQLRRQISMISTSSGASFSSQSSLECQPKRGSSE